MTDNNFFSGSFPMMVTKFLKLTLEVVDNTSFHRNIGEF